MTDHYQINHIWHIASLLRKLYRSSQYERVILPMMVLRRLDCVLAPTKELVLLLAKQQVKLEETGAFESILHKTTGHSFYNTSPLNFEKLQASPNNLYENLSSYIECFSNNVREIFEQFEFTNEIFKLQEANILYFVIAKFCDVDLSPKKVDNITMGALFDDLIRRCYEAAHENNGEYFTPPEVTKLMVDVLFNPDKEFLARTQHINVLDPVCGTSSMLSQVQSYGSEHNLQAQFSLFGQDSNSLSCAIAASNMLIKIDNSSNIRFGDSLTNDQYKNKSFDYLLAHPPFGLNWKKQQKQLVSEWKKQGFTGRFGAGLPRVDDASLLFLLHMISKFEPYNSQGKNGSRLGIIFSGSPLFNGGARSGESEIRKWIIENDWLEAIIALPEYLFYNTGIYTFILIITNRKIEQRKGKIQLIDARNWSQPMHRNLGNKRYYISDDNIALITRTYNEFVQSETSKIFNNEEFGYNQVFIERPLRLLYQMSTERKSRFFDAVPHLLNDVQAIDREFGREPRLDWSEFDKLMRNLLKQRNSKWKKYEYKLFRDVFTERNSNAKPVIFKERRATGNPEARVWGWWSDDKIIERMYESDLQLRDFENVRLIDKNECNNEKAIIDYFYINIEPYVPDAWVNKEKIRSGYKIDFNRYFYKKTPLRPLTEIDADLKHMEREIIRLMREVIL